MSERVFELSVNLGQDTPVVVHYDHREPGWKLDAVEVTSDRDTCVYTLHSKKGSPAQFPDSHGIYRPKNGDGSDLLYASENDGTGTWTVFEAVYEAPADKEAAPKDPPPRGGNSQNPGGGGFGVAPSQ